MRHLLISILLLMGYSGYVESVNSSWSQACDSFKAIASPLRGDVVTLIKASSTCHITFTLIMQTNTVVAAMPLLSISKNSEGFRRAGLKATEACS